MTQLLDFNDAAEPTRRSIDADLIRDGLLDRLESMLRAYLPAGVFRAGKFQIGNARGEPGDSLSVSLDGPKRGQWYDFATSQGGDHIELFAQAQGLSARSDFREVLERAAQWLGTAPTGVSESVSVRAAPQRARPRSADAPDLGPPTAKWDYLAADGALLACVYRYEPEPCAKEFRPWNVRTGRFEGLDPRPLYNQPALARAETVILVEGEKCAQALIDLGICATTAMHGARAPVDKTDWSPLAGKDVLIWPDKDSPGWDYAIAASEAIVAVGARSCAILLPPEDRNEGWDCADAVVEQVDVPAFIRDAERMVIHGPALPSAQDDAEQTPAAVWGTEDGMALHFTARYAPDWRYVAAWGQWLVWTGMRWVPEATLRATDLIRAVCRQHALEADSPRLAAKLAASGTVAGVERLARSDRLHAANADEWDADPWLLNTLGGVVDLRNGNVRPHDRADRMTKLAAARLGDVGACPTWRKFLVECTGGDSELIDYLQRICGYCLTGQTCEHALFFLYGTGANGKSVFVNTLSALLAEYATHAPMEMFMETRSDRHPTDLAGLRGARLVSSVETEQGRRWNESKIKTLTGGDKVSARFMRQDFFEYIPQFKLLIAGNHKPSIRNLDEAMRRRLQLIPFTITVPPDRRDKQLEDKIWRERDAVLAWMAFGSIRTRARGDESMDRRGALKALLVLFVPSSLMARMPLLSRRSSVSTLVGTGSKGFSDQQVNDPYGLVIGPDGALYFCDLGNQRVRRFDFGTRRMRTVAGSGEEGYLGDGSAATKASLGAPHEIQFDSAGHLYIAERDNHVIRMVDAETGVISTFAGTGTPGFSGDGGPASQSQLRYPHSIAVDPTRRFLLICDIGNHRIRRVEFSTGLIDTFAGTGDKRPTPDGAPLQGTPLNGPRTLVFDSAGDMYLALREGNAIFRVDSNAGTLHHVAGTGKQGYSGDGGPARLAELGGPKGLAWIDGFLYVADTENHVIREIDLKSGLIRTVLGTGRQGDGPEPDPRRCALARPHGVLVDSRGVLYVGDSEAHRIRILG